MHSKSQKYLDLENAQIWKRRKVKVDYNHISCLSSQQDMC